MLPFVETAEIPSFLLAESAVSGKILFADGPGTWVYPGIGLSGRSAILLKKEGNKAAAANKKGQDGDFA